MTFSDNQTIQPFLDQDIDSLENGAAEDFLPAQNDFTMPAEELSVDVFEDENNVYVKAPMPGVKPENLDINIDGEILTIQGSRRESSEQDTANYFCRECNWGEISRSIVLPMAVINDRISAALNQGVLTVTLPKAKQ